VRTWLQMILVVLISIGLNSNAIILDQILCRYVLLVRHSQFLFVPCTEARGGCAKDITKNCRLIPPRK
jgi:hypothetical protein